MVLNGSGRCRKLAPSSGISPPAIILFVAAMSSWCCCVLGVAADAPTLTATLGRSRSATTTITPPPSVSASSSATPSGSFSVGTLTLSESLVPTPSFTFTHDPGVCRMQMSSSFATSFLPYSRVRGAPLSMHQTQLPYMEIRATDFSRSANVITVALVNGIFTLEEPPERMVVIVPKAQPVFSFIGPAEAVELTEDFNSGQKHGLEGLLERFPGIIQIRKTLHTLTILIPRIPRYRIHLDEWIAFNIFTNASVPGGCATQVPIVLHITVHARTVAYHLTQFVCFAALLCGVVAAVSGTSIPTSHHAGHVALLASLHFAQEDGRELGLAIHPLQVGIGESKYQYVISAIVCNCSILIAILLLQLIALMAYRLSGSRTLQECRTKVTFPRITVAAAMHLAPGTFYALGRNFGNQSTSNFILCVAGTAVIGAMVFWVFHPLISAMTVRFNARYVRGKPPIYSLLANIAEEKQHIPQAHLTFLRRSLPELVSFLDGHWESIDPGETFVFTHGFPFENYTKQGKHWMGIETVDFFLVAMLTLFDNYTPLMAFLQFIFTLVIKLATLFLMIRLRPVSAYHSAVILFVVYVCEAVACFAVLMSSVRRELHVGSTIIQDAACVAASLALLADCAIVAARSLYIFSKSRRRERGLVIEEDTTELYAPPVLEGQLLGSAAAVLVVAAEAAERQRDAAFEAQLREERRRQRNLPDCSGGGNVEVLSDEESGGSNSGSSGSANPAIAAAENEDGTAAPCRHRAASRARVGGGSRGNTHPRRGDRVEATKRKRRATFHHQIGATEEEGGCATAVAARIGVDGEGERWGDGARGEPTTAEQLLPLTREEEEEEEESRREAAEHVSCGGGGGGGCDGEELQENDGDDSQRSSSSSSELDSAYDSDGLPILDHPRHLEREASLLGRCHRYDVGSGGQITEEKDRAGENDANAHDDADDNDGEAAMAVAPGSAITAAMAAAQLSQRYGVQLNARRPALWGEIAENVRGVVPRSVMLEGDFEVL